MARRVVVVDHHDSFTYLLADYLAVLGADCRVVQSDAVTPADVARMGPRGILLSPGPGRAQESTATLALLANLAGRIPILGVCLGHQAIALHCGASVKHARAAVHGKSTEVHHDGQSLYRGLPSPLRAGRYHSLVVDAATLPPELTPVAVSHDDGHEVVMGIRHAELAMEGIQFHPESVLSEYGLALLNNWLERL